MDRERSEQAQELEDASDARPTTSRTGGGGEAYDDADTTGASGRRRTPVDIDQAIIGQPGSGGAAGGIVGAPPEADVPDPMGRDDDEREVERRTR